VERELHVVKWLYAWDLLVKRGSYLVENEGDHRNRLSSGSCDRQLHHSLLYRIWYDAELESSRGWEASSKQHPKYS